MKNNSIKNRKTDTKKNTITKIQIQSLPYSCWQGNARPPARRRYLPAFSPPLLSLNYPSSQPVFTFFSGWSSIYLARERPTPVINLVITALYKVLLCCNTCVTVTCTSFWTVTTKALRPGIILICKMQKNIEIDIASYVFSWQLFLAM